MAFIMPRQDTDDMSKLVEHLESFPAIWNVVDPAYFNREIKNQSFIELASLCGISVKDCQKNIPL